MIRQKHSADVGRDLAQRLREFASIRDYKVRGKLLGAMFEQRQTGVHADVIRAGSVASLWPRQTSTTGHTGTELERPRAIRAVPVFDWSIFKWLFEGKAAHLIAAKFELLAPVG
jgi:hypothetical protein